MKFADKKVIIFDLDGTLIDSAPDLILAVNHMLKTLNRKTFSEEKIRSFIGNGTEVLVKRALSANINIDKTLKEDFCLDALEIFLDFYSQNLIVLTTLYPKVHLTLKVLKDAGYVLVIVTNKPYDFIEPILKALDIDGLFEFYLGGDSLAQKKPSPLPLLYVCQKLGVLAQECVMVGDSKNDILASKSAKMQSIGLSYGYNYGEDIGTFDPDFIFDDFSDIVKTFI